MTWTVSRRIITGYAIAMLLLVGIAALASWQLSRTSGAYSSVLREEPRSDGSAAADDERDQSQDDEQNEQHLGDACSTSGNATEAKKGRNEGDD